MMEQPPLPPDENIPDLGAISSWINLSTMGHVSHGKSTLVGYLLWKQGYFSKQELDEAGGQFSHLMDRTPDERRRGLTIQESVASYQIGSDIRAMIVDNPGHHAYMKNLVNGLSVSQAGLLVMDCSEADLALVRLERQRRYVRGARRSPGIARTQMYIAKWLGIRQFVVAVSKMDRVGFDQELYELSADLVRDLILELNLDPNEVPIVPTAVDVALKTAENVTERSVRMPWAGCTLIEAIQRIIPEWYRSDLPLRAYVMEHLTGVSRKPNILRVFLRQGRLSVGDSVIIRPPDVEARVASIWEQDHRSRPEISSAPKGGIETATPPMLISVEIQGLGHTHEGYIPKGSVLFKAGQEPLTVSNIIANVLTMPFPGDLGTDLMCPGREFTMEMPTCRIPATLKRVLYTTRLGDIAPIVVPECLGPNTVGRVELTLRRPVQIDTLEAPGEPARFLFRSGRWLLGGGVALAASGPDYSILPKILRGQIEGKWPQFEQFIASLFSAYPWLRCTPQAVAKGIRSDILAGNERSDGVWGRLGHTIIFECKYWSSPYGSDVVLKLSGQVHFVGATSGIIVAGTEPTGKRDSGAMAVAGELCRRGEPILLMGRQDIIDLAYGTADIDSVMARMWHRLL